MQHTGGEDTARQLRLRLLGRFELRQGDAILIDRGWKRSRAKALIKLLALQPSKSLHREQVLEALWPELEPDAAANNLFKNLHYIRTAVENIIGAAIIEHEDNVLTLSPALSVDIDAFRQAASRAEASRNAAAYAEADALWTGDLLPEDRYEPWTEAPRDELNERRRLLLLDQGRLLLDEGDARGAEARFQEARRVNPLDEEAHTGLMQVYARTGQRDKALRQYDELTRLLRDELNIAPSAAMTGLRDEILATAGRERGGTRPARLIVYEPGRPVTEISLLRERTTIGRAPNCDVVLGSSYASRQHARVERASEGYLVRDLGSRNGTVLNDRPLRKPTTLSRGDEIRVADTLLRFDDGPPEMPTTIGRPGAGT
jgi:DNA-binding SARP family transcriptional activator